MGTTANWTNQTIFTGDNLDVLRGMNSECVDLIYLDPPFNSNANYAAPIGSQAANAAFKGTWGLSDLDSEWCTLIRRQHPGLYDLLMAVGTIHGDSMMSYLIYMTPRLMELKRVLKPAGSIYLHCDPTASHYLKLIMDAVYGMTNYRNEIVWCYSGGGIPRKDFPRKHDVILRYGGAARTFNVERKPYEENTRRVGAHSTLSGGADIGPNRGTPVTDWWIDVKTVPGRSSKKVGYPTQKPPALIERIIKASSNRGDIVLEPFCGCATTCLAAARWDRQWVGIGISSLAAEFVQSRLIDEFGLFYQGVRRSDIPQRTDLGDIPRYDSPANKKLLYGEQEGYCLGCGGHFYSHNLIIDHIIPQSKGGTDHLSNLQLLCGACNSTKSTETQEVLLIRSLTRDTDPSSARAGRLTLRGRSDLSPPERTRVHHPRPRM